MTATVPDEFVINSITPSVGSCNIAGQVVTCSVDPSPQWFIINYTMNLTAPGATDSYPMSFAANYPFFNTGPNLIVNTCGNSIVEGSEQCDDGNSNYGDGCTPDCQAW
jgi:cysteine-rich repeat protein